MKKHLFIVTGIIIACVVLGMLLLWAHNKSPQLMGTSPTPITVQTVTGNSITLTPTPDLSFASLSFVRNAAHVDVYIDTAGKTITAAQLSIAYDPVILQNMQLTQGPFFSNALTLKNTIDQQNGKIFYAVALAPNQSPLTGKGIVASLSFSLNQGVKSTTTLQFLPQTKATTQDIDQSIIKHMENLTFPTAK